MCTVLTTKKDQFNKYFLLLVISKKLILFLSFPENDDLVPGPNGGNHCCSNSVRYFLTQRLFVVPRLFCCYVTNEGQKTSSHVQQCFRWMVGHCFRSLTTMRKTRQDGAHRHCCTEITSYIGTSDPKSRIVRLFTLSTVGTPKMLQTLANECSNNEFSNNWFNL